MPTIREIETLAREKLGLKDKAVRKLVEGMEGTQRSIFQKVIQTLGALSQTGGSFRANKANTRRLTRLMKEIREIILNARFTSRIDDFMGAFDQVADNLIELHLTANGITVEKSLFENVLAEFTRDATTRLQGSVFESSYLAELRTKIGRAVVAGQDAGHVRAELERFILGEGDTLGRLHRYVDQIATDLVNQFDGALNQAIGNAFEYEWLMYVGSVIKTTRPQCRRWVGRRFLHRSELEREIAWASGNGSGMIPGTTVSNFSINRGGYRCRHDGIWVDASLVPVVRRAQFA